MKILVPACVLSLLANCVLGVWVLQKDPGWSGKRRPPAAAVVRPSNGTRAAQAEKQAATTGKEWTELFTDDMAASVAHLRAAGFPPNIVRAIVAAQVAEQFRSKFQELISGQKEIPYWKKKNSWSLEDAKFNQAVSDLHRQEKDLVTSLAGPDPNPDPAGDYWNKQRFGDLSADKVKQAQDVESDYGRMQQEIYLRASGGMMWPSDQKELAYLEQQKSEDLAKVMTPEELAAYQMRTSGTAMNLHNKLAAFDASEDEYKAIFQIQQAADQQNQGMQRYGPQTPEQIQQYQAAQKQIDDQIATALGPDRFAQYKQETDQNFLSAYRVASRLNLPTDSASQVVSIQQDTSKQAQAIRQDSSLAPSDRDAQLSMLYQTANIRVSGILGPDGADAYKQSGGYWLQYNPPRR